MKHLLLYMVLCTGLLQSSYAQLDSIQSLKEVVVVDRQLREFSTGQLVSKLTSAQRLKTANRLGDLLKERSLIHIRQNGYGMVASASFRGTTAQQTAVVWNGININSAFNGQADFNTLPIQGFSDVSLRPGGGSVIYGSGAIGGSIHLNNELYFKETTAVTFYNQFSSFNTLENFAEVAHSTKRSSLKINLNRSASDNDYPIANSNRRNLNGQFEHYSVHLSASQKIKNKSRLTYHGQFYDGLRHFSVLRPSENKSNYKNTDWRNILEWAYQSQDFRSVLKYAYLNEAFDYNQNINTRLVTSNRAETHLVKSELYYQFKRFTFNFNTTANQTLANGDDIVDQSLRQLKLAAQAKYAYKSLELSLGVRQEFSNFFDSPLLFALGSEFSWTKYYTISGSISRNFRQPTLNDLFWLDDSPELLPETAWQFELNHNFKFEPLKLKLQFSTFYNDVTNMIRWLPNQNAIWTPKNVDAVKTYGLNAMVSKEFSLNSFKLSTKLQHELVFAEDAQTGKQLIYTPKHQSIVSLNASYKQYALELIGAYTGRVFAQTDNAMSSVIDAYVLTHVNIAYRPKWLPSARLNFGVKNILDVTYQTIENRPMPGQQFYINTLINL